MRQILLDTETTGLSPQQNHRLVEIGCLEMVDRRLTGKVFHTYLQPDRPVDPGATQVHGITDNFLLGKPRFAEVAPALKAFITGAELIIHNAPFDVGFLEYEFSLLKDEAWQTLDKHCQITDTLILARKKHPGQRNNLDALCKRYGVDNRHRDKHGALLDAHLLADVYLAMTGGQNTILFESQSQTMTEASLRRETAVLIDAPVIRATPDELAAHESFLQAMEKKIKHESVWRSIPEEEK